MKKKIFSAVLVILLVAMIGTVSAAAASVTDFTDVPATAWYYDYVKTACDEGLISGTSATTFSPDSSMSRGQFVTVLGRYADVDVSDIADTGKFTDVPAGQYYAPYVYWAAGQGIVHGTSDTKFAPDMDITKEQMATLIYRYAEEQLTVDNGQLTIFKDADEISDYAVEAVETLKNAGVITGNDAGNFQPQKAISRAEAMTLLVKFIAVVTEKVDPDFIDCRTIYADILSDSGYATSQMYLGEPRRISVRYVPENTTAL